MTMGLDQLAELIGAAEGFDKAVWLNQRSRDVMIGASFRLVSHVIDVECLIGADRCGLSGNGD
jgi:hypothetical protein